MHYVYVHYRKDDNLPFYVGKGMKRRAWSRSSRNPFWKNTANKHGYFVEILLETDEESVAFLIEKLVISSFKNQGFCLTNLSSGGEAGPVGCVQSEETKNKRRLALRGKPKSEQHKRNSGEAQKGKGESYLCTDLKTKNQFYRKTFELIEMGFDQATIYKVVSGKRKSHKGFKFERMPNGSATNH